MLEWARKQPLFTLNQLQREFHIGRKYLRTKLHRWAEKNKIHRIQREKYTTHQDPLIYGTHIITPSYFSLWTALRYYNLTTQQPTTYHVMTPRNKQNIKNIIFHQTKHIYGYTKTNYKGHEIFIAEKEKLLLDCLNTQIVPIEELEELLQEINPEKTIQYALKTNNKTLNKRTGYLLESRGKNTGNLIEEIDHNYAPLDLNKPTHGPKNKKWKIKVNTDAA